jgi:hypothetical protein
MFPRAKKQGKIIDKTLHELFSSWPLTLTSLISDYCHHSPYGFEIVMHHSLVTYDKLFRHWKAPPHNDSTFLYDLHDEILFYVSDKLVKWPPLHNQNEKWCLIADLLRLPVSLVQQFDPLDLFLHCFWRLRTWQKQTVSVEIREILHLCIISKIALGSFFIHLKWIDRVFTYFKILFTKLDTMDTTCPFFDKLAEMGKRMWGEKVGAAVFWNWDQMFDSPAQIAHFVLEYEYEVILKLPYHPTKIYSIDWKNGSQCFDQDVIIRFQNQLDRESRWWSQSTFCLTFQPSSLWCK